MVQDRNSAELKVRRWEESAEVKVKRDKLAHNVSVEAQKAFDPGYKCDEPFANLCPSHRQVTLNV